MIWLTWRQFRGSAALVLGALALAAVALAVTGPAARGHPPHQRGGLLQHPQHG